MKIDIMAKYLVDNDKTIREVANYFNISKSVLHRHLNKELKILDYDLYLKVQNVLKKHQLLKHLKGGLATKIKYSKGV